MSRLYDSLSRKPTYWDKRSAAKPEEWFGKLLESSTLYIGNLNFYVTEDQVQMKTWYQIVLRSQIYDMFSVCGVITKVIVGLNSQKRQPCGFCFIQFTSHEEASIAHTMLNGSILDERIIRCDWDTGHGITADRKYGRGSLGGQIRDERRINE